MKTSEILRQAKGLIDRPEKWWCPSKPCDDPSQLCAGMAIDAIGGSLSGRDEAYSAMGEAVGKDSIWGWNDDPRRTHAEVMAAFDKAIALAEGEERGAEPHKEAA